MKYRLLFILLSMTFTNVFGQLNPDKDSKNNLIITADGNCTIDTFAILTNKNLLPLIKELESKELLIYQTIKSIPPFINDFLKCSQGGEFTIANPGEKWQVGDVIIEDLPRRQLIFFGLSDSIALMTYYTGGIGKSEHILIFKIENKIITDFWCGDVLADLLDKAKVIKYLKKNKDKESLLKSINF